MIPIDVLSSIVSSVKQLPHSAIPPMLDCLLASTGISPHDLFSQLLSSSSTNDENGSRELNSTEWISVVIALCHLLSKLGGAANPLELFIWKCVVPLTKSSEMISFEIIDQILRSFLGIVERANVWDILGTTLIPFYLRVIGESTGMSENEDVDIFKWKSGINFYGSNILSHNNVSGMNASSFLFGPFPLPSVCRMLSLILATSVQCAEELSILDHKHCHLKNFLAGLLRDLCYTSERLLLKDAEQRYCAINILIPSILKALSYRYSSEMLFDVRDQELSRLWKCCKQLFRSGISERKDAYTLLSLYLLWKQLGADDLELKSDRLFWEEIKAGLIDADRLIRKQSLHILKSALHIGKETQLREDVTSKKLPNKIADSRAKTKREVWAEKEAKSLGVGNLSLSDDLPVNSMRQWEAFILLYEMLDEYGTHLVEAAWGHQINFLLNCRDTSGNFVAKLGEKVYTPNENALEVFNWLAILWKIGFIHENPQVRCLIMKSFLSLDWDEYANFVRSVPHDFILGPLLNGLNDTVHHTDFGIWDVYSSATIQAACKFFRHMSSYLDDRTRIVFVGNLASICRHSSLCRAGLMCLAECVASVACVTSNHTEVASVQSVNGYNSSIHIENESMVTLDSLRYIVESCKQHFNPNYRMQVCEKVLAASRSIVSLHRVTNEAVFLFISAIPREYFSFGGFLRNIAQEWLSLSKDKQSINTLNGKQMLKNQILEFPKKFTCESGCQNSFTDEDVGAWECEARRWARVFFIACENDFSPIATFITLYGADSWNHSSKTSRLKFCLITSSLVIEVEGMLQKGYELEIQNFSSTSINKLGMFREMLARACLPIKDKLLSYANSCSSIFWSSFVDIDNVPVSFRGQLGGPSWRRLSPAAIPDVLHAITSIRTTTRVTSLFMLIKRDDVEFHSCWSFLWEFFWKLVSSSPKVTESRAELCLGAYEALVDVLRVLASAASSDALSITKCIKKATCEVKNVNLLDLILQSFMKHINNLANMGVLTQARRAVLMHYKWVCLESILSIIRYVEYEVHTNVSGATIRSCFSEIVESLDTAGDDSVLPMLKSVKVILDLLTSSKEAFGDVDPQMIWSLVRSSWVLYSNSNKRRVPSLAALLSSVLHSSVFTDKQMHFFNNESGPLKWFVECFLKEGSKSPRSIRLAALHLSGLFYLNPCIIEFYTNELKLLTLYGTVAFDEDFLGELVDNRDARTEVSLLAQSPDPDLANEFINTELYPRICVAVLFHNLGKILPLKSFNLCERSSAAFVGGKLFLLDLLKSVVNDKDLAKELYKKYSAIHRRKIRAWQMICVLSNFVTDDIVWDVTNSLHLSLKRNNLPGVRQYLETFAINIYLKFPHLVKEQLIPIIKDYETRPQALSSYVFIAANVIIHSNESLRLVHLDDLLPPIIPLLTSHHHSLRGFTQLLVHHVLVKFFPDLDSVEVEINSIERRALRDLKTYLSKNPDCARLRRSMEGYLDNYDPYVSSTPAGIFINRVEDVEFECVPSSLMEEVLKFLNGARDDLRSSMANDLIAINDESLSINHELNSPFDESSSIDFQKKISLYEHEMPHSDYWPNNSFERCFEMEREDLLLEKILQSRQLIEEKVKSSRQQIIIVASLLDRIPNLAGLARTCEVFKALGFVVADKTILKDKQFQLISVTAEKWVPVIEISVKNLRAFLEKKKWEGFSILGLEQTANSISIDKYKFPKKSVIVLGAEKEGIPVDIIHILDTCIEIPQLGVVRSLNVHVSGAIALWEYTRQQISNFSPI